ncbi:sulfate permease, SulP family [Desulfocicer vacuolatum DSM 3385]|uniref:Sulfate permease, SulP family n=1 Tax=Desulfocicer vacuolatum DSM 3385 TaxID=1121400 RepID=A0A1W2C1L9_9BACT|nr:sulfate permease [Desulfocicer vacuolatum]SMC78628.1 sulfate permease, SulP family [Desulfocicer vacuolatum DSM 3385]
MGFKMTPASLCVFKEPFCQNTLINDIISGIIVGIVALPLAIAFAIASGVSPEQGIYTAVVAGFLISVFSGSKIQIGGPTGAFIIVVFGIVQEFGYSGLAVATIMAGVLLVLMGLTRMGQAIRFIPYPMTIGFTSGIALIIFTTQVQDFLGLSIPKGSAGFLDKCLAYAHHFSTLDIQTAVIGVSSILIMTFWPKVTKKVPGSVIAILATTVAVSLFGLSVDTIGSRFGAIPTALPTPALPHVSFEMIHKLSSPALTIALLAAIESLLCAVVADGITGDHHDSNMELVAQGIANIVVPMFGGIPATGAIARTATNIKSGGKTPVAGIVHAATLLLIMLCFGKWATLIPMATLAAILMVVAYHMSEWRYFVKLFKSPKNDLLVMLATFFLTVFVDLTIAIEAGVVLSAILFMNRMSQATVIRRNTQDFKNDRHALKDRDVPESVEVFEIQGPFFFGAANRFKDTLQIVGKTPKVLILRCRHILFIDATALHALEELVEKTQKQGTLILLSGIHAQPLITLEQSGLYYTIGEDNIFGNIDSALNRARQVMGLPELPPPEPFIPTVERERVEKPTCKTRKKLILAANE